jgi:hypothetical protein
MPVVNTNTGTPLRFESGGFLEITPQGASDNYSVLYISAGTLRITERPRQRIPIMDKASFVSVLEGDEQAHEIDLDVLVTKTGLTTATTGLMATINPTAAANVVPPFQIMIKIPDARGGSVGTRYTCTSCYLRSDGTGYSAQSGENADRLSLRMIGYGLTRSTY